MGLLDAFKGGGGGSVCKHESRDVWPQESESIWYLLGRDEGGEYWAETDAAFIKLKKVTKEFICLGCGETRSISSGKRVGGGEAIKPKSEIDVQAFRGENGSMAGAFYNGFPDELQFSPSNQ